MKKCAKVLNNNGVLTENRWAKPVGYTVGGAAIGAGVGMGIAAIAAEDDDHFEEGIGIGAPVGAAVGLVTGLTTPGRTYKANDGDFLWLELTQDLVIPN